MGVNFLYHSGNVMQEYLTIKVARVLLYLPAPLLQRNPAKVKQKCECGWNDSSFQLFRLHN